MRLRRELTILISASLIFALLPFISHATPKQGSKCTKIGVIRTTAEMSLKCVKRGSKLIWRKSSNSNQSSKPITGKENSGSSSSNSGAGVSNSETSAQSQELPSANPQLLPGLRTWIYNRLPTFNFDFLNSSPNLELEPQVWLFGNPWTGTDYTAMYTGFLVPDKTGTWQFEYLSDDAFYLWIGKNAVDNFNMDNTVIVNPGIFPAYRSFGSAWLEKDRLYPIRILYGADSVGLRQLQFKVARPGEKFSENLRNLVFHQGTNRQAILGWNPENVLNLVKGLPKLRRPGVNSSEASSFSVSSNSEFDSNQFCKLPRPLGSPEEQGTYGFPRGKYFLPNSGSITGIIVPVAFPDATSVLAPEIHMEDYLIGFNKFWTEMSRGTLKFDINVMKNWIVMPKKGSDYAKEYPDPSSWINYVNEVIARIDDQVDFSKYRILYIVPVDGVTGFFPGGPVVASGNSEFFQSKEGPINNVIYGAYPWSGVNDLSKVNRHFKWQWLAHETGHLFGIPHPHLHQDADKTLTTIFSAMDMGYVAPGLYGWERWLIGWIPELAIRCFVAEGSSPFKRNHILTPLGSGVGEELLVYKVGEQKAIVIENRQSTNVDQLPAEYEGVLVYEVDTSKPSESIRPVLHPDALFDQTNPEINGGRAVGTLVAGETATYGNIKVRIVAQADKHYLVEVSRN